MSYTLARDSTSRRGTTATLLGALPWAAGIGLFAAVIAGQGVCESGDAMFGYCEERGAPIPYGLGERAARFAYWFLLIAIPAVIGATDSGARLRAALKRPTGIDAG